VATWSFAAFDWVKYRALAPVLRRAQSVGSLRGSADAQVADAAAAFDDAFALETVCNVVIAELCTTGEWVSVRAALPVIVQTIMRRPAGEDAADVLTELALAGHNIEPWFAADRGLMGILTRAEVEHLASHLAVYSRESGVGSLPGGLMGWARKLKPITSQGGVVDELISVVLAAEADRLGLAAILEP
jgi:hypothetical protein